MLGDDASDWKVDGWAPGEAGVFDEFRGREYGGVAGPVCVSLNHVLYCLTIT
jgi:hypothetical protein